MHKTEEPCDCGTISMMLNDPDSGLTLSEDNTFWLSGTWCVYHCPFCGGLLPDSSKPIWHPRRTDDEKSRLEKLTEGIATAEEAIQRLGPPDYDGLSAAHEFVDGKLSWNDKIRNIEYYNLSESAAVEFYFGYNNGSWRTVVLKAVSPRHMTGE